MNLSSQANEYLNSLRRHATAPAAEVAELLRRRKVPEYEHWLDFQCRYGGYEERIAHDRAIWGLVHHDSEWLPPNELVIELDDEKRQIACADTHPSYDYWLDEYGQFFSSGHIAVCGSFEVKVERDAILWNAIKVGGRSWTVDFDNLLVGAAGSATGLCSAVNAEVSEGASDQYATCWVGRDVVVFEEGERVLVYYARDARDLLLGHFPRCGAE